MQISSRFTIATHMMIIIAMQDTDSKVTSDFLAASVGVNPVIIRKTLSQLKKAGLISVARGTGGTEINKRPSRDQFVGCLPSCGVFRKIW